ncbi:MAG: hypothetical protein JZU64_06855 [Rhodoferax sp.]|nr:hypothetical protein [Rhodoferax sp.]
MTSPALLFEQLSPAGTDLLFGSEFVNLRADITLTGTLPALTAAASIIKVGNPALLFDQPAPASTNLLFGDSAALVAATDITLTGTLPALTATIRLVPTAELHLTGTLPALTATIRLVPTAELHLTGTLPALTATMLLRPIQPLHITATLPALQAVITASYHSNTQRPTVATSQASATIALATQGGIAQKQSQAQVTNSAASTGFEEASAFVSSTQSSSQQAQSQPVSTVSAMQDGQRTSTQTTGQLQDGNPQWLRFYSQFQEAARLAAAKLKGQFQDGMHDRRPHIASRFQEAKHTPPRRHLARFGFGNPLQKYRQGRYQDAWVPRPGRYVPPPIPVVPPPYWGTVLLFQCPPLPGPNLLFGTHPCHGNTAGDTITVPVQRVYIVLNSATLRRVAGNISLPALSMSLSLDANSWTWSFSATLPTSAQADLEPDNAGNPVEVEASINGVPYRALIEKLSRSTSFGKSTITASGRGLSAQLDTPYAPVGNFGNAETRTAQQLLGDILTLNAIPLPWTVDWQMEDWDVPPNLWRHQGSYISAINSVVQAAGGYLQPHASSQTLHALHRYPQAPWEWASATPDYILPADIAVQEAIEWAELARYNRVFVSGTGFGGILGQVTRTGSDGSQIAPMVTDPLITSAVAARRRGIKELSPTGRQALLTLSLPVLPATGIIAPGKMVRYDGRMGLTRAVSVNVGRPSIRQQIQIETYA